MSRLIVVSGRGRPAAAGRSGRLRRSPSKPVLPGEIRPTARRILKMSGEDEMRARPRRTDATTNSEKTN